VFFFVSPPPELSDDVEGDEEELDESELEDESEDDESDEAPSLTGFLPLRP
jgi:hypothetical protein